MTLNAGTQLGPYKIVAALGAGGMGEVYRARDSKLDREVAVKVLPDRMAGNKDALKRLEREAKALAALNHPNILAVHDLGEHDETVYVVLELLEGETLRERLRSTSLDWRRAIEIAAGIADGLAAAHTRGIVHRDLKPENVFLTRDGLIKILDFGLAAETTAPHAICDSDSPTITLESPGMVVGTAAYMSPEQARGMRADARSDVFALGCVLHEMITGRCTFARDSAAETMAAILRDPIAPLHESGIDAPPEVDRVVRRCLEKRPDDRFQSARDLAFTLRGVLADSSGATPPTPMAAVVEDTSIAVLPFSNMSADPENEYFSDGMTEEIINALSRIEGLRVAARSSCFAFKGRAPDIAEVGSKLRVATILEGSVRKSGDRLRITVQLVNVADGYHLWSERFDRNMDDIFAVQDEIAAAIADKLRVTLTGTAAETQVNRSTDNVEAYDLYLKGRFFWEQRGINLLNALEYFEQALALDPEFASAHAGIAESYSMLGFFGLMRPHDAMPKAKGAAHRAIECNSAQAEAYCALALVETLYEWNWDAGRKAFRRCLELDPHYVPALCCEAAYLDSFIDGDHEAAVARCQKAVDIDPLGGYSNSLLATILYIAGRIEESMEVLERTIKHDPTAFILHRIRGLCHRQKGDHEAAIESLARSISLSGRHHWPMGDLQLVYVDQGRTADAVALHEELVERSRDTYVPAVALAFVPAALGRADEAYAYFDQALEDRDATLLAIKRWPSFVDVMVRIGDDPRFVDLIKRIGIP